MLLRYSVVSGVSLVAGVFGAAVLQQQPMRTDDGNDYDATFANASRITELESLLSGRWVESRPIGAPCFSQHGPRDPVECGIVRQCHRDDRWIARQPNGYFFANWGSCQTTGETCAIPQDKDATIPPDAKCHNGSIPDMVVQPTEVQHIQWALEYASLKKMPVVIKNTGHDWKGRSAAPGALSIWTHHLQNPQVPIKLNRAFLPSGCDNTSRTPEVVFQFGAGEQWGNLYNFAHENNLTALGGTCPTVGVAGWVQGGGHSPLTPWKGMGVDNVREFEIVTPGGEVKIANECFEKDLFFAVRGGGGGTYGVVTRITYKALEEFPVQALFAKFEGLGAKSMSEYFDILTTHAPAWSDNGWGGYIKSFKNPNTTMLGQDVQIVNANSSFARAQADLIELTKFLNKTGITYNFTTYPSWHAYFKKHLEPVSKHPGGWSGAVASRLLPRKIFTTPENRTGLTERLLKTFQADVNMWLMLVTPTKFNHTEKSALHPTWKNATLLLRVNKSWDQFLDQKSDAFRKQFQKVHDEMDHIRKLAPDMGVSMNEADIWEEKHEAAYWGTPNFEELERIKSAVDPWNLLTNHGAVGWDETDTRYKCYPKI